MISIESEKLQCTGISDLARDASGQVVEGDVQEDKVLEHSNLGRDATCNTVQQYTCYISCCEQRQQDNKRNTRNLHSELTIDHLEVGKSERNF
jgi:hypothetical protein